jgi:23S rRNA (uracil1939-C5)-methyltransferase
MQQTRLVSFKISTIDPLGQGVSKITDKITFIPKTLPGEEGEAVVLESKKGVQFAELKVLKNSSARRMTPECPHFEICPGCHFLHTDYEHEIEFKKQSLEKILHKLSPPSIKTFSAPKRLEYRNRIQLHYNLKKNLLGMFNGRTGQIAPTPNCLIGRPLLRKALADLYQNNHWQNLIPPKSPPMGHVELYEQNNQLKISWNRPYADGGFTQVFEEMNQLLKKHLHSWGEKLSSDHLIDLFAGQGNLSNDMKYSKRLCIDIYPKPVGPDFFSLNLHDEKSLEKFERIRSQHIPEQIDLLILDPPRSGLKNLNLWVSKLKPLKMVYVSCDPHTLTRDLASLSGYKILEISLFDFFPSTFHFETMVFLERK